MEEKVSGSVTKTYTLGHDVLTQQDSTNGILHFLYDGHGSTRALLNASAAIATNQVFNYDAFGNRLDANTALTSLLYSGEQTDATGMQYLRARYYNPATGTFNRLDPYAGNMNDPQSLHKYLYAHANPIMGIDPTGMWSLGGMMVSIGIQAGLTAMVNYAITHVAIANIINASQDGIPNGIMLNVGASVATTGIVVGQRHFA